jgi:hypothetical protein
MGGEPLTLAEAEALAQRTRAMIDANEVVTGRGRPRRGPDRYDTDRARVATDRNGLRQVERLVTAGLPDGPVAPWLPTTFPTGCLARPLPTA